MRFQELLMAMEGVYCRDANNYKTIDPKLRTTKSPGADLIQSRAF